MLRQEEVTQVTWSDRCVYKGGRGRKPLWTKKHGEAAALPSCLGQGQMPTCLWPAHSLSPLVTHQGTSTEHPISAAWGWVWGYVSARGRHSPILLQTHTEQSHRGMCYSADFPADLHRRTVSDARLRSLALQHPTSQVMMTLASREGWKCRTFELRETL